MAQIDFSYEAWPSGEPYDWLSAGRGDSVYDALDYHVDLGCGTVKKGRIGIDRHAASGVNIVMDLNTLEVFGTPDQAGGEAVQLFAEWEGTHGPIRTQVRETENRRFGLPFDDSSIESIISHHALEHIGPGFIPLVDEVYRVLKPGGIFYPIVPLFPSTNAVEDPDHKRYFTTRTWDTFVGHLGDENNPTGSWHDSFSVPYSQARFEKMYQATSPPTPPERMWGDDDHREIRVALRALKA